MGASQQRPDNCVRITTLIHFRLEGRHIASSKTEEHALYSDAGGMVAQLEGALISTNECLLQKAKRLPAVHSTRERQAWDYREQGNCFVVTLKSLQKQLGPTYIDLLILPYLHC